MRILMAFHALAYPPQSGVLRRTFHMLEETLKRHQVTIVSLGSASDEAGIHHHFRSRCTDIKFVRYDSPKWINFLKRAKMLLFRRSLLQISVMKRMQETLDEVFREYEFDLVFLSSATLLYYRRPESIPCVTDSHNVEYDLWYRMYRSAKNVVSRGYFYDQYRMMKRDELQLCGKPDVLLATSERDREVFERDLPGKIIRVIPNGVDLGYFTPQQVEEVPHSMVFSGVMNYLPNTQGVLYFIDKIFPLVLKKVPDAKVFIVGAAPSKAVLESANEHVVVTGRVDDVRTYVAKAQVYVVPLLVGGGTRLKALEASAMKKPIVSTSVGCEGIDLRNGESILFADKPEELSEAVVRLFDDPEYRTQLAERAHSVVSRSYDWRVIGDQLSDAFEFTVSSAQKSILQKDLA
jgi:glycosyltransferase involved in cell wall biosynthesis